MLFNSPTGQVDRIIASNSNLERIFHDAAIKTSKPGVAVVKTMLEAALNDETLLVPTPEHPYLDRDSMMRYKPKLLPDVPTDVEKAARLILDSPEACRILYDCFQVHFVLIIHPYKGGIMVRGLLSMPGGR